MNPLAELVNHLHLKAALKAPVVAGEAVAKAAVDTAEVATKAAGSVSTISKDIGDVVSFMEAIAKPTLVVADDIIKYTPDAVKVANVLLPEYAVLEDAAGTAVIDAVTLLKNGIIMTQQKYAGATPGAATNTAKKTDVLTTFGPAVNTILTTAGIKMPTGRLGNMVDALVQMLNSNIVPVTPATA